MNIKDLRYLVAVAEIKHFGKAATHCNISQPTLSMQLKKLEDYLNVQLIERKKSKVMLTDIGKVVYDLSKDIIQKYDELILTARNAHNLADGDLKIGIISTLSRYIFPDLLNKIKQNYPALALYCIEDTAENLIDKVKHGELDCAIVCTALDSYGLDSIELFSEKLKLLANKDHPLAVYDEIEVDNIIDEKILLLEPGHCLREQVLNVCSMARVHKIDSFNATSLDAINIMVANNRGVALVPESAGSSLLSQADNKLIAIKSPSPKRVLGMYWRSGFYKSELITNLAKFLQA